MEGEANRIYHAKVDSSGRIVLPAEARQRNHIAEGDTVVLVEDGSGFRLRSLDQVVAEAQSHYATLAPPDVLLSDEINADRRSDAERD